MDVFSKFNQNSIDDRQVDTLIGLSKGLIADGKINQLEAEVLLTWLIQNSLNTKNPLIHNLLNKVAAMLDDGILDSDEAKDLFATMQQFAGESSIVGELAKTTSLPICTPPPEVIFNGKTFLFTGTCAFGTRSDCQNATKSKGGNIASSVTKEVSYLVLGTYVTDSWKHETFGRKIEKATQYRDQGLPISIITENHWLKAGGF